MTLAKITMCAALFLAMLFATGCGYLDEDLWVDDQTFEEELYLEGMSISGSGHGWGCGGVGRLHRRRARMPHVRGYSRLAVQPVLGRSMLGYGGVLSDKDILEHTDVDIIEVGEPVVANTVEEAYYETKAERDESIVTHYAAQ